MHKKCVIPEKLARATKRVSSPRPGPRFARPERKLQRGPSARVSTHVKNSFAARTRGGWVARSSQAMTQFSKSPRPRRVEGRQAKGPVDLLPVREGLGRGGGV